MADTVEGEAPASMLGVTFRRATVSARFYLVYGTVMSTFLGVLLATLSGSSFASAYPLVLPIFGVIGSMGGLVVFTSDRQKGVLEYLLSYGMSPRRLFLDVLLTSLALVTVVVGVSLSASLSVYLAHRHPLTTPLVALLGVYAVPMAYASAAFATTIGMFWTALSSPRQGMSSPVGLAPFFGMLPPLATLGAIVLLVLHGGAGRGTLYLVIGAADGTVALVVALLLASTGRLLRRERLLSPA